jgi:hypothetical protein
MSIGGSPKAVESVHGASIANGWGDLIIPTGEIALHPGMNHARLNLTLAADGSAAT